MAVFNPSLNFPVNVGIDGGVANTFSWNFNKDASDTSVQTDYQVFGYALDNTLIYDSAKITSASTTHVVPLNTFTNGTTPFKWKVDVFVGATVYASRYSVFEAIAPATLNINTLPNPFTTQFFTFTATYSQAQNVSVKTSQWRLYDASDALLLESDVLFGETLSFEIEGFDTATTYKIECEVINQNDKTTISPRLTFTPTFTIPDGTPVITTTPNDCFGTIAVDWESLIIQTGSVDGTSSYVAGKFNLGLELTGCLNYIYANDLPDDFTLTLWNKVPANQDGWSIMFYKDGEVAYTIGYGDIFPNRFYYIRGYRTTASDVITLPTDFFLIGVTSDRLYYTIDGTDYELY